MLNWFRSARSNYTTRLCGLRVALDIITRNSRFSVFEKTLDYLLRKLSPEPSEVKPPEEDVLAFE